MANSAPSVETTTTGAQTLARGLRILEFLVAQAEPQRASQIARSLEMERSAVYRLLRQLESHSLISREPENSRFTIGSGLVAMSARVMRRVDLRRCARPLMERLSQATRETICLYVRHGCNRICVETVPGKYTVSRVVEIGATVPIHSGPSGKAILAFIEPAEMATIVADAYSNQEDRSAILGVLDEIRQRGFIASVGDRSPGVGGLSAPVFNADGIIGALTISGPASRWDEEAMAAAAPLLVEVSQELSDALGYRRDGA
jgi:DNA-binding IclR family transcriptional regulator